PARYRTLQRLHREVGQLITVYRGFYHKLITLTRLTACGCPTVRVAHDIAQWGVEQAKPNAMRKKQRYKTKNVTYFVQSSQRLEATTHPSTEKASLVFFLKENWTRKDQRLQATRWLLRWGASQLKRLKAKGSALPAAYSKRYGVVYQADPIVRAVDMLYTSTKLYSVTGDPAAQKRAQAFRAAALKMTTAQLVALKDPLLQFARALMREVDALEEGPNKKIAQYLRAVLHPQWVEALNPPYPDANSTVRLSFGRVLDYTATATGKLHRFVTDIAGLLKKHRGRYPFNVPKRFREAFVSRKGSRFVAPTINDIPVNFTTTLDTTGGNSGSPVLDARGKLIGLLFDGTPEAVVSDWQYQAKEQRSICVDIRYALYLASVEKALALLKELGVN
ncbi:MAG: S46 family peptidase, partial [Myxococcales bacterium]|nr:S46 family peptidase [Myxococcales bacterium]